MRSALIVFAKVPSAGQVKTRLTSLLDEREAAELYEAFLLDALDIYSNFEADVRLYIASDREASVEISLPNDVKVFEQRGDGLGERMATAFVETFLAGYDHVAIVGTDHPTLPTSFIEYALKSNPRLRSVTIGPADDGGYYLLAMNEFHPAIFRGMSYSHPGVFEQTLERISQSGCEAIVLPLWYDVDEPADLRRLHAHLAENEDLSPRTGRLMKRLVKRYPELVG